MNKYNSNKEEKYANYLNEPWTNGAEDVIYKDIMRTFPADKRHKEDWNSGKNKLFNVLKAYSNYDPEVSYCQGMNFIVFIFLKNLDQDPVWNFKSYDFFNILFTYIYFTIYKGIYFI